MQTLRVSNLNPDLRYSLDHNILQCSKGGQHINEGNESDAMTP